MSITLLCLVKGNITANTFSVKISKDKPISELKKAIKVKKHKTFHGVEADELKLWKVKIHGDHDDQLSNISFQDSDELLAIRKISKYFPDSRGTYSCLSLSAREHRHFEPGGIRIK